MRGIDGSRETGWKKKKKKNQTLWVPETSKRRSCRCSEEEKTAYQFQRSLRGWKKEKPPVSHQKELGDSPKKGHTFTVRNEGQNRLRLRRRGRIRKHTQKKKKKGVLFCGEKIFRGGESWMLMMEGRVHRLKEKKRVRGPFRTRKKNASRECDIKGNLPTGGKSPLSIPVGKPRPALGRGSNDGVLKKAPRGNKIVDASLG